MSLLQQIPELAQVQLTKQHSLKEKQTEGCTTKHKGVTKTRSLFLSRCLCDKAVPETFLEVLDAVKVYQATLTSSINRLVRGAAGGSAWERI